MTNITKKTIKQKKTPVKNFSLLAPANNTNIQQFNANAKDFEKIFKNTCIVTDIELLQNNTYSIGVEQIKVFPINGKTLKIATNPKSSFNKKYSTIYLICTQPKSHDLSHLPNVINVNIEDAIKWLKKPIDEIISGCHGHEMTTEFVKVCISTNTAIKSYKDDPFSIRIDNVSRVCIGQYLAEDIDNAFGIKPYSYLQFLIEHYPRLAIQALAGSGKSTFVKFLVHQSKKDKENQQQPNLEFLKKLGLNRVIFAAPTTAIAEQQAKDFRSSGLEVGLVVGGMSKTELYKQMHNAVIIVCFDSLHKIIDFEIDPDDEDKQTEPLLGLERATAIKEALKNTLLIVDEFHQMGIDFDYRDPVKFQYLFDITKVTKQTILLSATPQYFFCSGVCDGLDYKLALCEPSIKQSITIKQIDYTGKKSVSQKDFLNYVLENKQDKGGLTMYKKDSKAFLNSAKKYLDRINVGSTIMDSDNPNKKGNINYLSLMNKGFLTDDEIKFLLFTSLLEAGVSIKQAVDLIVLCDVNSWQKCVQLMSRARYNHKDGTNKKVEVWIFNDIRKKAKEYSSFKHSPKEWIINNLNAKKKLAAVQNERIKKGEKEAPKRYSFKDSSKDQKHYKDFHFNLFSNQFEPCVLKCLLEFYELERNVPIELMLKRIERFDSRVTIERVEVQNIKEHKEIIEILEQGKEDKENTKIKAREMLESDFDNMAQCIAYISKDSDFKNDTRELFNLGVVPKDLIVSQIEQNAQALKGNTGRKLVGLVFNLMKQDKHLKKAAAIELVLTKTNEEIAAINTRKIHNSRVQLTRFGVDLGVHDDLNLIRNGFIIKSVQKLHENIKAGRTKENRTSVQIGEMVNTAIKGANREIKKGGLGSPIKTFTNQKALAIVKAFFEVKSIQKRTKKGVQRLHIIGDKLD